MVNDIFIAIFFPLQIIRFATANDSTISLILHAVNCLLTFMRFAVVYIALRNTFKRQEDVRVSFILNSAPQRNK